MLKIAMDGIMNIVLQDAVARIPRSDKIDV